MTDSTPRPESRLRLPFDPASASRARHQLADLLQHLGVRRGPRADALLIVHELVMNGLEHGRPDAEDQLLVFWAVEDDLLHVGVHDAGTTGRVEARPLTADSARGRGLAMVSALSESWLVRRNGGTEVSAWIRIAA